MAYLLFLLVEHIKNTTIRQKKKDEFCNSINLQVHCNSVGAFFYIPIIFMYCTSISAYCLNRIAYHITQRRSSWSFARSTKEYYWILFACDFCQSLSFCYKPEDDADELPLGIQMSLYKRNILFRKYRKCMEVSSWLVYAVSIL